MTSSPSAASRRSALDRISVFLALGLGLSPIPLAIAKWLNIPGLNIGKWSGCGLVGSALGILTYLLLPLSLATSWWMLAGGILFAVVVSHRAEKVLGVHDDTRIVIDEWIGAWIAAVGVPHAWGLPIVAAFLLFRVFDVVKGPFGLLQRLPGGWGVTMDDVGAGIGAAVILHFIPALH